jgi:hypothetical protein
MILKFMTSKEDGKASGKRAPKGAGHDQRCLCGNLIARLVEGGVEIKCRRCQRIVRVPLEPDDQAGSPPPP